MPSSATITAFYSFSANTKARSSQVNANFSLFRGHVIPIEPLTATGSHVTYDLGSTEYRWRYGYMKTLDLQSSTTTGAALQIEGDTGSTTGTMNIKVGGTISGQFLPAGFNGAYVKLNTMPPTGLTQYPKLVVYATNGAFVLGGTGTVSVIFVGCGGGAGGGGGAGSGAGNYGGGGGGGGGAPVICGVLSGLTAGQTLTSSYGAGGAGGATTTGSNTGTSGSAGSTSTLVGTFGTLRFPGASNFGRGGVPAGAGGAGGVAAIANGGVMTAGGNGATQQSTTGGTDGEFSPYAAGGAFNSSYGSASTGGGGGGGGASAGAGGAGGAAGASGIANPTAGSNGSEGSGGGGGGGGANGSHGEKGGTGGTGVVRVYQLLWG